MKRMLSTVAVLAVFAATLAAPARADVKLPRIFTDHMVLQRDLALPIWGTAQPGEKVTVKFGAAEASAEADAKGNWSVKLPAQKASSSPAELVVTGKNTLTVKDVLVGDVWLCSGQSNMEMALHSCNAPQDIAAANYPTLRRIKIALRALSRPSTEVQGQWEVCSPRNAGGFTAVGFYFARRVQKEVDVPIGLIDDNWGGTRIEPWVPPAGFAGEPTLANTLNDLKKWEQDYRANLGKALDTHEQWIAAARAALADPARDIPPAPPVPVHPAAHHGAPVALYNAMVHPVVPYGLKGALWYQGESNGGESESYYHKMRALVNGWRQVWGQGDFPFYYVQLANFLQPNQDPAGGDGWAKVRMAQTKSLTIPNTGMAVIIDIGEANDIHPKNKFDVGERLALWALRNDYGKQDLVVSGPLYKSMEVAGDKVRIRFESVGGGLMVGKKSGRNPTVEDKAGKLKRFAIAGEDRKWVWADAVIEGDCVVVSAPGVTKPVAVRYAFSMNPEGCNLYNREGLPASPFRTDDW